MASGEIYRKIKKEKEEYILGDRDLESKLEEGEYPIRTTKKRRYDWLIEHYMDDSLDLNESVRMLDVASSTGIAADGFIEAIESQYRCNIEPYAFDINKMVLEECKDNHLPKPVRGMAQELPFQDDSFKIVISNTLLLQDVQEIRDIAEEIDRVMKSDGIALLGSGYRDLTGIHEEGIALEKLS